MAVKTWSLLTPAVDALKNTICGLIRDVKMHCYTAAGFYVEAQATPDRTVAIYAGIAYFGIAKVKYVGLDSADLGTAGTWQVSALTPNYYNKILFTINSAGEIQSTEGTEGATAGAVVEPAIPAGKYPICMITVQDDGTGTAGTILSIEQSEIEQIQGVGYIAIADTAYGPAWNGIKFAPTQDAVYDEMETKADKGANSDITSLAGLTTPLTKAQGGSGTTGDSIIKAWCQFEGGGGVLQDSFNVASITDNGTGDYTVNWDTDFANNDYAVVASGAGDNNTRLISTGAIATGTCRLTCVNGTNSVYADAAFVTVIAIGDQ